MKLILRRAAYPVLASLCLLTASCGGAATPSTGATGTKAPSASKGPTAPDFSLPTLDGKTVRLSDHFGKDVVLINFWSTTCDPCMAEMPHLVELYKKHKDKGFVILAISRDGPESRAQVSSVAHDKEMIFPVLLDEETTVFARYNPKGELPFNVLIDKNGAIVHKRGSYNQGDEKALALEVDKALSE